MKVVLLAGGLGTRISEESHLMPKPMIHLGEKPILVHIMEYYAKFGFSDFIILAGYKNEVIFEYFRNFHFNLAEDISFDISNGQYEISDKRKSEWSVRVINSGLHSQTAGRMLWAKKYLTDDFLLTYGDGVSDVDLTQVIELHKSSNSVVTLTAVQPEARFGALDIDGTKVNRFHEKPIGDGNWINAGFFALALGYSILFVAPTKSSSVIHWKLLRKMGNFLFTSIMDFGIRWTRYAIK